MGSEHPQGLSVNSPRNHFPPGQYPYPASIFMFHAVFAFIQIGLSPEVSVQLIFTLFQIIWMCMIHPGIYGGGRKLFKRITKKPCSTFIENGFACLYIPLPRASISSFHNVSQSLFLGSQLLFVFYTLGNIPYKFYNACDFA